MSIRERRRMQIAPMTPKKKSLKAEIFVFFRIIVLAAVLAFLFQAYVAQPIRVDGTSMEGTLHDGEILLVSRAYDWPGGEMERGDIIICRYPNRLAGSISLGASTELTRHTIFVKRLVALPGDTVEIRGGHLYVNGEWVPDPEDMGSTPRDYSQRRLGENEYFVIGDNRFSSKDSSAEEVGPIRKDMIVGRVEWVIWPMANIRKVK